MRKAVLGDILHTDENPGWLSHHWNRWDGPDAEDNLWGYLHEDTWNNYLRRLIIDFGLD